MNVDEIINTIGAEVSAEDGDYYENGLLHCWKCKTPKQCKTTILGAERIMPCMCKCEEEKENRRRAQEEKERAMLRTTRLKALGFPDEEMALWTFDRDADPDSRCSKIARNYVENFDQFYEKGKGLLFYGTVGTGKTFLSACIVNALIEKGHPCLCTNFARITNTIQSKWNDKQQYLDSLNRFHLLVIDDLAAERDTEYMGEIVMSIIDARYRSKKPIIVTTNLTMEELKNPANIRRDRVVSRLFEMCGMVEVNGIDRRKLKAAEDQSWMAGLLGL